MGLHFTIHIKEYMLIQSCVDNYATFDGTTTKCVLVHSVFH
jgi:hypothetical protein